MRRASSLCLSLLVLVGTAVSDAQAKPTKGALATISGSVQDNKGNPLAGALVFLIRDGVKQTAKEAMTDRQGNFIAKVFPGRYGIKAIANGFKEVVFASFELRSFLKLFY